MHEKEIQVVDSKISEGLVQTLFHIFWCVLCVPQFTSDEDLRSRHLAFENSITYFDFIAINGSTVDVTIAAAKRDLNSLLNLARRSLPGTKTDGWDFGAGIEYKMGLQRHDDVEAWEEERNDREQG